VQSKVRESSFKYRAALSVIPLTLVGMITFLYPSTWFKLIPMASSIRFLDLSLLTFNVDCFNAGQTDLNTINCDPGNRDFNYPTAVFKLFVLLDWNSTSTVALGFFLFLIVSSVLAMISQMYLAESAKNLELVLWSFVFASPPVLLLIERGNIDSLMFGMLALCLFFAKKLFLVLVISVVGFTLKIFLIGMSVFGLLKKNFVFVFLGLSLSVSWFLLNLEDFRRVFRNSDYYEWFSFGSRVLPIQIFRYFGFNPDGKILFVISSLIGFSVTALIVLILSIRNSRRSPIPSFFDTNTYEKRLRFGYAGGVWTCIFFMGLNFDMRLIFLIPVFMQLRSGYRRKLLPLFVFFMYSSFGPYGLQTIGDLLLTIFTSLVVFELLSLFMENFKFNPLKRFPHSNTASDLDTR
jgi:hypothetical protein